MARPAVTGTATSAGRLSAILILFLSTFLGMLPPHVCVGGQRRGRRRRARPAPEVAGLPPWRDPGRRARGYRAGVLERVRRGAWGLSGRLIASYILVTLAVVVLVQALVLGFQVPQVVDGVQAQATLQA